jgi:pyruvate dehydrogenase E1 component alpha subunit
MTVFGDGASNEGAFHESLNMASIWKLPVIYLLENNQYAMSMSIRRSTNIGELSVRASSYGMPGVTVDGNDLLAVHDAVCDAANRARRGEGPSLVECVTYRWRGHSRSDRQAYRTRDEVTEWQDRDPIRQWAQKNNISDADLEAHRALAKQRVDQAIAFAEASPDPKIEDVAEGVYA